MGRIYSQLLALAAGQLKERQTKVCMKTQTLEIAIDDTETEKYPDCYISIPPNGKVCSRTGLRHTHLYNLLSVGGAARPYVRVVNLREPGASKGKTLFHLGDLFRFLSWSAKQQGAGELRSTVEKALREEAPGVAIKATPTNSHESSPVV